MWSKLKKWWNKGKQEALVYKACKEACEKIVQSKTLEEAKNLAADALAKGD